MLNLRQVDRKFFLAGGWENVATDAERLRQLNVGCVLDLQYVPDQPAFNKTAEFTIRQVLEHFELEYWIIPMFDGIVGEPNNPNLEKIYQEGYDCISAWLAEIGVKKILIKCGAGLSRSPSMLIYFLCRHKGISFREAYDIVLAASPGGLYMDNTLKDFLKETFPDDTPSRPKYNRKYGF